MESIDYDKTLYKTVDSGKIIYGILYGNENIVFIKVGTVGDIAGYQDKYLKMAKRAYGRLGSTVICASNPSLEEDRHLAADESVIREVISECGFQNPEVHFVGTSDGGNHSLRLSERISYAKSFLGINSSCYDIDDLVEQIEKQQGLKKIFVYGERDVDFGYIVPRLRTLGCDNLKIITIEGVDHKFKGRVDDFIALIDLI